LVTTAAQSIAQKDRSAASARVVQLPAGRRIAEVHPARGAPAGAAAPDSADRDPEDTSRLETTPAGGILEQEVLDL